ncbi:transcriptional regulator TbsP [Halobaculum sp. MBLA0147]|uniref:transcriptional regulator TbsP n=1 Tax=Halobaculum sp. MBLA0147 TaxID=3079934 RepID=UPI003523E15D
MVSNLRGDDRQGAIEAILGAIDGDVVLVDPSPETFRALVDYGTASVDALPEISVLADEDVLKDVRDDFLVASDAADLVEAEKMELRVLDGVAENTVFVGADDLYALVPASESVAALAATDEEFVADAHETFTERFEAAEAFDLRTPGITRVRETMDEDIGPDARADFDAVLASLETARGNGEGLDEVTISLLVAAKNEALLYDISKWGEDIGIASKATFSRTKTELEDMGIIDTEKVPIDVGRPRLRLKFGDTPLADASSDELAAVADRVLN